MKRSRRILRAALVPALVLALAAPVAWADYEQAMNYFKSGRYAEAAAEFQTLVDQAPEYAFGYYMLGLSLYKMGKLDDAAKNIEKAIELDGGKFNYRHALANVYRSKGDQLKALKVLNEAESLASNSREKYALYSLRGFVYVDLEKWGEAVQDLEQARAMKKSPQVLDYLGRSYFKLGYYDKAVPVLRESLKVNPNSPSTHLFLAEALVNLARESQDKAKEKALYHEALQVAMKYRKMRPGDWRGVNVVGKSALGAGDYKTAEEAFLAVLELKPEYCYALVNLGKVYLATEKWKAAEEASRKATQCAPRLAVAWDNLGFALQKQKRLEEAREAYQRAYSLEPSASIKQRLEVVEKNLQILEENKRIEEEQRKLDEQALQAQKEYEEQMKKVKEWEKKRDD